MKDRAMQALFLLALEPVAESTSDPNSYGFRRNRSTSDAEAQIFNSLRQEASAPWVLEADIKGCFDNISHEWLLAHVLMDKEVLRKWLKAGTVFRGQFQATDAGTPQGGIISPTLANVVLNGLERSLVSQLAKEIGIGKADKLKVNVVRYADDFIITGASDAGLESLVKPKVVTFLAQRGLELSPEKTRITHIAKGFDFLGWNFRKYSGKMLIRPSKKNVQAFYRKLKETISKHKTVKQEDLIRLLNPMLRGWAQYHLPVNAKQAFSRMDYLLFRALWRWSVRRHPAKNAEWVRKKYFHSLNGRNWVFGTMVTDGKGAQEWMELYTLAATPIKYPVKIAGEFNPFDPQWEQKGEKVRQERMLASMRHRKDWSSLYKSQQGLCGLCQCTITKETGWNDHHIQYRVYGGSDALSNRILLHPDCHTQVHSLGLTVVKPTLSRQRAL
jgi:RNA-directed DNA polymerase